MINHKGKATVRVIGAGLAGAEASYQLAKRGISVILYEMKPHKKSPAHKSATFAELVCSNSLRSDDITSAIGLLHEEMRRLDSLILKAADATKVPAGGALAVDREAFGKIITQTLETHPNITIIKEEMQEIPDDDVPTIIATGPLTTHTLAMSIQKAIGEQSLYFFDALAPIIHTDSIDMDKAWHQSRYDKGGSSDYINCPMSQEEYETFVNELVKAEKIAFKDFEQNTPYFEGCLPIEVMAERGMQTLSYGPMKPVGLTNPHKAEKPYAVVQLRQDNQAGTLVNMVGFQTKLTHGDQVRIFRTIKGLENAEFARLGGIHRNTFINSPKVLDETLRLKTKPNIRFAGQITGCEGYTESASIGLLAGLFWASELKQTDYVIPPKETAIGALLAHITNPNHEETFQPMNINFGLIQTPKEAGAKHKKGRNKKEYASMIAQQAINAYIKAIL